MPGGVESCADPQETHYCQTQQNDQRQSIGVSVSSRLAQDSISEETRALEHVISQIREASTTALVVIGVVECFSYEPMVPVSQSSNPVTPHEFSTESPLIPVLATSRPPSANVQVVKPCRSPILLLHWRAVPDKSD